VAGFIVLANEQQRVFHAVEYLQRPRLDSWVSRARPCARRAGIHGGQSVDFVSTALSWVICFEGANRRRRPVREISRSTFTRLLAAFLQTAEDEDFLRGETHLLGRGVEGGQALFRRGGGGFGGRSALFCRSSGGFWRFSDAGGELGLGGRRRGCFRGLGGDGLRDVDALEGERAAATAQTTERTPTLGVMGRLS
jgi:hypothetical protein